MSYQGPSLVEWMPHVEVGSMLPSRSIPRGTSYSHITFDSETSLIVVASLQLTPFASFDEDGGRIWAPDGMSIMSWIRLHFNILPQLPMFRTRCVKRQP